MNKFSLTDRVREYFQKHPDEKFTGREIAQWIYDNCLEQRKIKVRYSTSPEDLGIITTIRGRIHKSFSVISKRNSNFKRLLEEGTRKYYYTEISDIDEIKSSEKNLKESNLYAKLSEFLWSESKIYSKRIHESKSKNTLGKGGNEWLYPDIVGMEDLSIDWNDDIKDTVQKYGDTKIKLWSFEVKMKLNRSNIRRSVFQAVSNSSWANLCYLVAIEIDDSALKELRILTNLHGIGFILLNVETPSESQIIIPAKERTQIDWDIANRLADENSDFLKYVKLVRSFCILGETVRSEWDIPDDEEV